MDTSHDTTRAAHAPDSSPPRTHPHPTNKPSPSTVAHAYAHTSRLSLTAHGTGYFLTAHHHHHPTTSPARRKRPRRIYPPTSPDLDLHQSTCLNLGLASPGAGTSESSLWILPEFDEWEVNDDDGDNLASNSVRAMQEGGGTPDVPRQNSGEWGPLLARAVNSNRERLRRRLEGDGWDFVGGKYGGKGAAMSVVGEDEDGSQESVDEEFDGVVVCLPRMIGVGC